MNTNELIGWAKQRTFELRARAEFLDRSLRAAWDTRRDWNFLHAKEAMGISCIAFRYEHCIRVAETTGDATLLQAEWDRVYASHCETVRPRVGSGERDRPEARSLTC